MSQRGSSRSPYKGTPAKAKVAANLITNYLPALAAAKRPVSEDEDDDDNDVLVVKRQRL